MYTNTQPKFRTMATAFAAATIYTGLLLTVASPARAATPDHQFVRTVEAQLGRSGFAPKGVRGVATIAVRLDADGKVTSAALAGSTGSIAGDRVALNTARTIAYPKGDSARTVAVVLTYGDVTRPSQAQTKALVKRYTNAKGEALAAETLAPNAG